MPIPGSTTPQLQFGTQILDMVCSIEARSVQSFGLYVTDTNGDPVDLTGSVATLEDAETDEVLFTADTDVPASIWRWSLTVADTTVDWTSRQGRLVVTSGGQRRVWAQGRIRINA